VGEEEGSKVSGSTEKGIYPRGHPYETKKGGQQEQGSSEWRHVILVLEREWQKAAT